MSRTVSRTTLGTSQYAVVDSSPRTKTRPVVAATSIATRASRSRDSTSSRIASATASQSLSGWPSVTDSEVKGTDRWAFTTDLGPGLPRLRVRRLLRRELVNMNAHAEELQASDLAVDLLGNRVDARLELGRMLAEPLQAERL